MKMVFLYEALFWISALALIWIYFGYRLCLHLLNFLFGQSPLRDDDFQPTVSILLPTYNEIVHIARKIEECLAFDYPKDKIEIIVIDSNSHDGTAEVADRYRNRGVITFREPIRLGKARAVATGIGVAKGEIVISTDTNCSLDRDAIKNVVSYFADRRVGAVTAAFQNSAGRDPSLTRLCRRYWALDNAMKELESRLHSAIGLVGELAAVRRCIFANARFEEWSLPKGADDTSMSLYIIRSGYRIRFASDVLAVEPSAGICADYFSQKVRMITQNIRHAFEPRLPVGLKFGFYSALIFPTRRMLSPLSPMFLAVVLIATLCLLGHRGGIYDVALALQLVLYGLGVLGFLTGIGQVQGARSASFFMFFNVVISVAWLNILRNKDYSVWKKVYSTRMPLEAEI